MAFRPSQRKEKALSSLVDSTDLDITPIMNLLMILIPFLVSMATFTRLAVIEFSLPTSGGESTVEESSEKPPEKEDNLNLSIALTKEGFLIGGVGGVSPVIQKNSKGEYAFAALKQILKKVKSQYPKQEDIILIMEAEVLYEDIVTTMDCCRDAMIRNISLSGGVE